MANVSTAERAPQATAMVVPPDYHPSLRVKRHQASGPGVYELSFGDGGRALFRRGEEIRTGDPHIEWLAIGDHRIVE